MENLYVSDLFGYNATEESSVIIININNTPNLFTKIASNLSNNTSIYEYNRKNINNILIRRNINPNFFLILGHILSKMDNSLPQVVILVNKSISSEPQKYEEVMDYDKGKIIRPYILSDDNEKIYSMGLFYSDKQNFNMSNIGIISDDFLTNYKSHSKNISDSTNLLDSNDFGLLSLHKFGIKTLLRSKEINSKFKLINNNNDNYLSVFDENVSLKQHLNSPTQVFSYNAQGELINDGKCLTHNNSKVLAESCDLNNSNQKWTLSQNKILPSNNFGKCLDVNELDKTTIELNDCDYTDTQYWDTEIEKNVLDSSASLSSSTASSIASSSDYTWNKYKGKTLALVENDNPWFINSNIVQPMKHISKAYTKFESEDFRKNYEYQENVLMNLRNNEHYKTDFIIDPESPTLGHGYSFLSRGGKACQKSENGIEHFEGSNDNNNNYYCTTDQQIIIAISLLAILLILYKFWKYSKL